MLSLSDFKPIPQQALESLVAQIQIVEQSTGEDEVVGAWLASFGQTIVIHLHQVRLDGAIFVLEGVTSDGTAATLVQHYSQASILLLKVPKAPLEEKRSIGFLV